jgi:phospholipid transport system substrate-binding protein
MTYGKALKVILTVSFVLNVTVTSSARASEPASPQGAAEYVDMLRGRIAAISALNWALNNESRPETEGAVLRDLIRVGFDLDVTSQFVLGKFWGRAKAEQRAEFKNLFTEYLVNTYAGLFEQYRTGTLTVVASNRVAGGDFLVQTTIDRAIDSVNVVWRVRAWDSEYRIIDILIDRISLALTHRSEFASVIQRDDLEKLLQILRNRTSAQAAIVRQLSQLKRSSPIALSARVPMAGTRLAKEAADASCNFANC